MQIIMIKQEQDDCLKKERYCIKEEKKQQSAVLRIQNKIMDIDMHNIEGKPKYSRTLGCLVAFKI